MENEIIIASNAAIQAGKAIMEVYNTNFKVDTKPDKSPVTFADLEANEIINSFLCSTSHPIISEENEQIEFKNRKNWTKFWLVDPLDGTREFVNRNGEFTVNIALIEDNRPVMGVIFVPVSHTLYVGNVIERKLYKIQIINNKRVTQEYFNYSNQINTAEDGPGDSLRVFVSRSHISAKTEEYLHLLKSKYSSVETIARGSSLKFCLLAEGLADIYPRFNPTMEWDTAAGQAVCESVGIKVISISNKSPMRYNKENLLNHPFIAGKHA